MINYDYHYFHRQATDDAPSLRPSDLLLLVIVHDAVPSRRKVVQSIFRNKVYILLFFRNFIRLFIILNVYFV